jgi:hypothetical protein
MTIGAFSWLFKDRIQLVRKFCMPGPALGFDHFVGEPVKISHRTVSDGTNYPL